MRARRLRTDTRRDATHPAGALSGGCHASAVVPFLSSSRNTGKPIETRRFGSFWQQRRSSGRSPRWAARTSQRPAAPYQRPAASSWSRISTNRRSPPIHHAITQFPGSYFQVVTPKCLRTRRTARNMPKKINGNRMIGSASSSLIGAKTSPLANSMLSKVLPNTRGLKRSKRSEHCK